MAKHLGINLKRPKVLLCFDYQNGITDEEEDLMFISEHDLFFIGTINLPLIFLETVVVNIIQTKITIETRDARTKPSCNFRSNAEIAFDKKHEDILKDKEYPKTYYHHTPRQMQVDETPMKV